MIIKTLVAILGMAAVGWLAWRLLQMQEPPEALEPPETENTPSETFEPPSPSNPPAPDDE